MQACDLLLALDLLEVRRVEVDPFERAVKPAQNSSTLARMLLCGITELPHVFSENIREVSSTKKNQKTILVDQVPSMNIGQTGSED